MPTPSQTSAASQTSLAARHIVPAAAGPAATHTGAPLAQSSMPRSQGLPVLHGAPVVHEGTHVPLASQVPPGHGVPAGARRSPGHAAPLPSQRSVTSHGSADARHTAPAGATPPGTHEGTPPVHVVTPAPHESATTQGAPATQVVHPVALHARPTPHAVPGARSVVDTQTPAPPRLQSRRPVVQGLPVSHVAPSTQTLHVVAPPQTPPTPQLVPGGASSIATQKGLPEPQSTRPVAHGLPVSQTAPAVQTLQAPRPVHARPGPHPTPIG